MTDTHTIVDRDAWLDAHRDHLAKEKAFTYERERMAQSRRDLPWMEVSSDYTFLTPSGPVAFSDLFDDHSQLIVYHFMFGTDWGDEGCPSCSFWADTYNGTTAHLAARDTAFAVVSSATVDQIETYRKRMGWDFRWVSCDGSSFNIDMGATATPEQLEAGELTYNLGTSTPMGPESPLISVFYRDGDRIFLTYQVGARGLDLLNSTYHHLDLTPKGRDEADLPWSMAWLRRHDSYDE
ncbi:MAG: DUF899 domain-containing protein [Acidimicrobiales bacterium]|nr:DUF899 domain-containing protein [Acidimicrobiales bacterium]